MLSRLAVVRRVPRAFSAPVRLYSDSRSEGSVAQSKGFNAKEKAHEDQYIHQHELEKLAKLREALKANKEELAELQKQHEELEKKIEK